MSVMRMTRRETMTLTLSHAQAHALADVLDGRWLRRDEQGSELDDVRQSLADAIWLSRWQREDVSLELRNGEVGDVVDVLETLSKQRHLSEDDRQTVRAILDSIASVPPLRVARRSAGRQSKRS